MTRDEPGLVVALGECDERGAQLLNGFECPHPQQVFLQGSDEALGDAIALGFAHEGWRSFDAQTFDLALEVDGHVMSSTLASRAGGRLDSQRPRLSIGEEAAASPCRFGEAAIRPNRF